MQTGLFGGTFNPIHLGHLQVIKEVKKGFDLDRVYIIPAAIPPHKKQEGVADSKDRMEMIRLALHDDSELTVSEIELKRSGPSYTIDTVKHFRSVSQNDSPLFLIMGMDAFLEIDTWKSYMALFSHTRMIIMTRPGEPGCEGGEAWRAVEKFLHSRVSDGYEFLHSESCFVHADKHPVFVFNVTPVDISSTQIRKLIKEGRPVESLVPSKVDAYITNNGLYL